MTAIVGVLNKHAVAIAADSAVTLGGGKKVLNTANKLFALSKYRPVAIAIYSNAEFIGTPWEVIIKEYRKAIGKTYFSHLVDYITDFFSFLQERNFFVEDGEPDVFIQISFENYYDAIINEARGDIGIISQRLKFLASKRPKDFLDGFDTRYIDYLNQVLDNETKRLVTDWSSKGVQVDEDLIKTINENVFLREVCPVGLTGLVFAGYGEEETFPSLIDYSVGNVINGVLAKKKRSSDIISKRNCSAIRPFAQTDVMMTLLSGIAPRVRNIYLESLAKSFEKFKETLASTIQKFNQPLSESIKALDITPVSTMFLLSSMQAQQKEYINPFVSSVSNLEKNDLADFAESLIKLTSIKRKISFEQETVGGPIDVMLISKGDGVIWIKRKQYFDPDKNYQFFGNYFND